ncbi:helix-turn-helix domain-containing protein [Anaerococcus sp. Marseille-P9784]|uniref:helix-turn-helix domain-containing protein n=1 Tax=Anaerococcus sp. Marseille-P9784 TaxID=2614127 RepID=UPI001249C223|nr:helix-turn-helix domain-containing protein [Anaerococcus sp. Marseille-P9784]
MKSVNHSFANYMKNIRKSRKLTQEKLSELSYINIKTISEMENAKANIDLDKLETLSTALNIDLVEQYFNILFKDSNSIDQIINSLNSRDRFHGSSQSKEIEALEDIKNRTDRKIIKNKAQKLILYFKSIEVKDDVTLKRKLLLDALKINRNFDFENLENNNYSKVDYRILLNFAYTDKNPRQRLKIYKFIEDSNIDDNDLNSILFHNIANTYYILEESEIALEYINKAINLNSDNPASAVMLYTKSLILYDLSKDYEPYARKALEISKETDQKLYSYILNKCKNIFVK